MKRLVSIFFIFAFSASIVLASGDITQFVFTTNSQTIKPNEVSEIITIQAQDASGNSATSTQTVCIELSTTSSMGEFSSSNTSWISVKTLTMSKGSANRNFYYKDLAVGVYELSVKASLKPEGKPSCSTWPIAEWDIKWNAKQNIVVSSSFSSSSSQTSSSANNSSVSSSSGGENIASGGVTYNYKNEQISAKAGEDKTAVAGADIVLEGSAYGFKKEPLENARYLWNLGDGSYKEGKNIRHIYKYPNDNYIAVLIVSSGDISATDRVKIKVIPNELVIIDAKNEFIKLKNKSGIILDVSGWFLKANGAVFKFPDYSLVAANSELMISSDISKLKFAGNNFSAEILYPNGSVVFSYSPSLLSFSSSKPKEIVLSKPPEKNTETATAVAMIISKKNSSNSSASSADKSLPAVEAGQNFATEKNLANVITIGEKNNPRTPIWLILAVITGIIGGAGVFLARKFTYTEK